MEEQKVKSLTIDEAKAQIEALREQLWSGWPTEDDNVRGHGVDDALAILSRVKIPSQEWQPIETAPKDVSVIVWLGNDEFPRWDVATCREPTDSEFWVNGSHDPEPGDGSFGPGFGWFTDMGMNLAGNSIPTHWMPPPEPPDKAVDKDARRDATTKRNKRNG